MNSNNKAFFRTIAFSVLAIIVMFSYSCTLDRTNPLDPRNNNQIVVPNEVVGISLQAAPRNVSPRWIRINWQTDSSVDGYYIYKGLSRHSRFVMIREIDRNDIGEYTDYEDILPQREYWYRISAFKDYPEGRLEGKLSPLTETSAIWVN